MNDLEKRPNREKILRFLYDKKPEEVLGLVKELGVELTPREQEELRGAYRGVRNEAIKSSAKSLCNIPKKIVKNISKYTSKLIEGALKGYFYMTFRPFTTTKALRVFTGDKTFGTMLSLVGYAFGTRITVETLPSRVVEDFGLYIGAFQLSCNVADGLYHLYKHQRRKVIEQKVSKLEELAGE
jgi:hypothetical protein